jgi:hypothetical protein
VPLFSLIAILNITGHSWLSEIAIAFLGVLSEDLVSYFGRLRLAEGTQLSSIIDSTGSVEGDGGSRNS